MSIPTEAIHLFPFQLPQAGSVVDGGNAFAKSCPLSLGQSWNSRNERDFQPGTVRAAWCPEHLHIHVDLVDAGIVVSGPSLQSSLVVADIFQVFINRPIAGDYLELHVTPDNQSRVIAWTKERLTQFREGAISIDKILLEDAPPLYSETRIEEKNGAWQAYLRVPVSLIDPTKSRFEHQTSLKGTFCRFDAAPDSDAPVLSSTSCFKKGPKFHKSEAWHELVLLEN